MAVDFTAALEGTVRIAAVGVGLSAMELIADRRAFGSQGPFSASVVTAIRGAPAWLLMGPSAVMAVASLQLVAATILVVAGPLSAVGRLALVVATVTSITLRWRRCLGGDGAEQLTTIILIAAAVAFVPASSPDRAALAVLFVAGQSSLAYATAGIAKLVSPVWRDGLALPGILATYGHGHAWGARMLRKHATSGKALSWAVMLFETLFPVLLIAPYPVAIALAALGMGFHVGCAVLMGLNSFPWAFPATYLCLFAVRAHLQS